MTILSELERKVLWLAVWMIHHANHVRGSRGRPQGRRPSGVVGVCLDLDDGALLRRSSGPKTAWPSSRMPARFSMPSSICSAGRRSNSCRIFAAIAARSPTRREPRISTMSISRPGRLGWAWRRPCSPPWSRIMSGQKAGMRTSRKAGWSPFSATLRWMKAISSRLFSKAGSTACATPGGSSTTTGKALMRWCAKACGSASSPSFATFGWDVVILKHGTLAAGGLRGTGRREAAVLDRRCPNQLYSALTFQGGAAWRRRLMDDLGDQGRCPRLIERRSDEDLAGLMTNLGGHDLAALLDAFEEARRHDRPVCFIAYTIKGFGLPLAGHKDNHAGLMTPAQVDASARRAWVSARGMNGTRSRALIRRGRDPVASWRASPFAQAATAPLSAPAVSRAGRAAAAAPGVDVDTAGLRADDATRSRKPRQRFRATASSPRRPTSRSRPILAPG